MPDQTSTASSYTSSHAFSAWTPSDASGTTDREIGVALAIAPRTAPAHVEHILRKLGVARRARIAAWVVRR